MSYQKLNQVTRQLSFPIRCCDYSAQYIDTYTKYFFVVDMDRGYRQVVAEEEALELLAVFTHDGNIR